MSEQIPESIPTSADPRSKRPLKKRALNPVSLQAASLDALFSKPTQDLKIPPSSSSSAVAHFVAPPEIVANVQGSSAGAGSGEFHVYKASRRREYERLKAMDEEVRKEEEGEDWDREKREREERDREKTRRNREKRERGKKGKGKKASGSEKEGKVKARVELGIQDGEEKVEDVDERPKTEEVKGLVIHDDD